jgi:hypothetical protein
MASVIAKHNSKELCRAVPMSNPNQEPAAEQAGLSGPWAVQPLERKKRWKRPKSDLEICWKEMFLYITQFIVPQTMT